MKARLLIALLFTCFVSIPMHVAAQDYKPMTIRAATANPEGSLHTTAIDKFKEIVEKKSDGKIEVITFYGGSMGDEQANVKQLRSNEIQLAVLAVGNLTPFSSQASIYYMPYMFPKIESAYKLFNHDEFNNEIADQIAQESGTRPLSWLIGGYRHLTNSKHPVTNIDDLQGLKIRVPPVDVQIKSFKSWGVNPHPVAWDETFNALQQGVVDGQENPHSVNRDQKFWEVQDYITELHYLLWVGPMLFSETWYQNLPEANKQLVTSAAKEAAQYEWDWSAQEEQKALQQCLDHGMELHKLNDEEVWESKARALWSEFYDEVGGKETVDKVVDIIK
ncbi:TRAP transporter substrate-binding protein [Desulfohalobium retbaense]|uniref:TRAP dicarboxylate transporter, DctP subunit n=1 Tax=Desulfohalobium retbaense (strain ATCC 49708 / DSM 5692 / JCM 16813 / HR100) TaxID=485915 RepID=C8X5A9_DESRD|nr:TRAP transporter substrate-binding protein [Desulfohalobium retbaense]ACV69606.1 TRAP dicarboxylate transporter, DctP subunit [Desulfohalobium retbaense DSM 5692]